MISSQYGGTGLGLWITKRIIDVMEGDIRIESEYNKGASFILHFKVKYDKRLAINKQRSNSIQNIPKYIKNKGKSDYIVLLHYLNDEINRKIIKIALKSLGFSVEFFDKNIHMISQENNKYWAILINDYKKLKEILQYSNIKVPVIFISNICLNIEKSQELTRIKLKQIKSPVELNELVESILEMSNKNQSNYEEQSILLAKKTILLVSNEVFLNSVLKRYLNGKEIEVIEKKTNSEGIEYYKNNNKTIRNIVYDIDIPHGNGLADISKIREYEKENKISNSNIIIFCFKKKEIQQTVISALKIEKIMTKPINAKELINCLK